jgi:hypothetical protein
MTVSNEEKLEKVNELINNISTIGYRLDELLNGFKIYNENKNTLDITFYESLSDMFNKAINAMEEQMDHFHKLFWDLKDAL